MLYFGTITITALWKVYRLGKHDSHSFHVLAGYREAGRETHTKDYLQNRAVTEVYKWVHKKTKQQSHQLMCEWGGF